MAFDKKPVIKRERFHPTQASGLKRMMGFLPEAAKDAKEGT
jgi:hypothetical protein